MLSLATIAELTGLKTKSCHITFFFFLYPWPLITPRRAGSSLNIQLENMRVNFRDTTTAGHTDLTGYCELPEEYMDKRNPVFMSYP